MKARDFPCVQAAQQEAKRRTADLIKRIEASPRSRPPTSTWKPMYLSPAVQYAREQVELRFAFFRSMHRED